MSLQYIFPDHTARNRHIAIAVEISAAVIALVLMIWAGVHYWSVPEEVVVVKAPVDTTEARQALVSMPNPSSNLAPTEIKSRQEIVSKPNPVELITTEERRARQSLIENI